MPIAAIHPDSIRPILMQAGMPAAIVDTSSIAEVEDSSASHVFKILLPGGEVFFVKFCEREGARGALSLKHLIPIDDAATRKHAEERHRFIREALKSVVSYRETLVPRPLYFDLSDGAQGALAEYRVPRSNETVLAGTVGTLWQGMKLTHLPTLSSDDSYVWDPIHYAPEQMFACAAALGEFQREMGPFVEQAELEKTLAHEQRSLVGYDRLMQDFTEALALANADVFQTSTAGALQNQFLETVEVPEKYRTLDFHKLIFTAERDRWWTPEIRNTAKALARLGQAEEIARAVRDSDPRLLQCIQYLQDFKPTYAKIEGLPKAIVPQDAHPFNFLRNELDDKITMLDLEDVSMSARFTDLSTVYVYKILRGLIKQNITEAKALALIRAVCDGYNSEVAEPLTEKELSLMTDYNLADFMNHLTQFGIILRQSPNELNAYNLMFSLNEFLAQFELLQQISQKWHSLLESQSFDYIRR